MNDIPLSPTSPPSPPHLDKFPSASVRRGWIVGILALLASAFLSVTYFTHGDSRADIRKQWTEFYPRVRPGWAELKPSEIDYAFNNNPDVWTTLAVRTAYGRWRLRDAAPEAFDRIMTDYERGWWFAPNREIWSSKFQMWDEAWLEMRVKTLTSATSSSDREALDRKLAVAYERPDDGRLVIRFPGRPTTPEVGTRIRLVVDVLPGDLPAQPVKVYWETERAPGMAAHRRRLATWSEIDGAPEGRQRIAIDLDLSWEPVWIYSGSIPRGLHVRVPGTNVGRWETVTVEFGDSEWLRPRIP